jgi:hypothetical protein
MICLNKNAKMLSALTILAVIALLLQYWGTVIHTGN